MRSIVPVKKRSSVRGTGAPREFKSLWKITWFLRICVSLLFTKDPESELGASKPTIFQRSWSSKNNLLEPELGKNICWSKSQFLTSTPPPTLAVVFQFPFPLLSPLTVSYTTINVRAEAGSSKNLRTEAGANFKNFC